MLPFPLARGGDTPRSNGTMPQTVARRAMYVQVDTPSTEACHTTKNNKKPYLESLLEEMEVGSRRLSQMGIWPDQVSWAFL